MSKERRDKFMEPKDFSRTFAVKCADLDTNGHIHYSVYVDYTVDTQFRSIESQEYGPQRLLQEGFGPVILRMETRYTREVTFEVSVIDSFKIAGLSADRARCKSVVTSPNPMARWR
jgi:acyl-CoA thioester hydrolase